MAVSFVPFLEVATSLGFVYSTALSYILFVCLYVVVCIPLILFLSVMSVVAYYGFLFFYRSELIPGLNFLEAIMGPTHVGLSSSGIKLSWQIPGLSYYGPMVSWSALTEVGGSLSELESPELEFKFNRNGANAQFVIDPNGFLNEAEKELFLSTIESCVPKSALYPDARACISRARATEPIVVSDTLDQTSEQQAKEFTQLLADYSSSTGRVPGDKPVLSIEDKKQDQSEVIEHSVKLKKTSKQHSTN